MRPERPPLNLLHKATLFLDFDGTLVDLADRHDAIVVGAGLPALLVAIAARLDGRLAIVSGRPAGQIADYLGAGLSIAGSHGAEMLWADGRIEAPEPPTWIADVRVRAQVLRRVYPGVVIETKPYGVALHYRQAPDAARVVEALARELAEAHDLRLQPGKMVFELHAAGIDKGRAVRAFLDDPAMGGTPVFVGDDLTDEAGFRAAHDFGGCGVLVGAPRETAARYRLEDVGTTLKWLQAATGEIA